MLGTGAGGRLIGHRGHPLDHVRLEQTAQAHQHQADGAVAADEGLGTARQLIVDHLAIDRIEDDGRLILHTQGAGGIDPVALPAAGAQIAIDLLGVVATLAGDDHVQHLELIDVGGILERRHFDAHIGAGLASLGGGEEDRLDALEVTIFQHALHEHGTDHAAPTDETDFQHVKSSSNRM